MSRIDPQIDFDWDSVSPLPGNSAGGFAVRWTGVVVPPAPGTYDFTLRIERCRACGGDNHVSVAVDGKMMFSTADVGPTSGAVGAATQQRHGSPRFKLEFANKQPQHITVEMARSSSSMGGGISLDWQPPADVLLQRAVDAAKNADLVVAMVGLSPLLEGEEMPLHVEGFSGGDRTDISLPAPQEAMLEKVRATGKPMVVVLLNGSALAVNWAQQHANAILDAWYPGEAGGKAIAYTLMGKNNPGGRLPVTFYSSLDELPPFTGYSMQNRTYRYFKGKTLYDFGYGLSYTQFKYLNLKLSTETVHAGDTLTVVASVRNAGKMAGDEVTEIYLIPPQDGNGGLSPNLQLEGFSRIHLLPGETKQVTFKLGPRQLSEVDAKGVRSVQPGHYSLSIGGSQPKDPLAPTPAVTASFTILGSQNLPH